MKQGVEMEYNDIERTLAEERERFIAAWEKISNARIKKTQRNEFGLKGKYPLLIAASLFVIAAILVVQFVFAQFDVWYIICECIIVLTMSGSVILLSISWRITLKNAKCAEIIEYYAGDIKCVTSEITGGGRKVEWEEARFYFLGDDRAELFDGGAKQYQPFIYKKVRGHSRNYVLLDGKTLAINFIDGAIVTKREGGVTEFNNGFKFKVTDGNLEWFEIKGMYSECYENNFPLYAPLTASRSYVFRYEFEEINRKNYRMILPEIVRAAAEYYFIEPPKDPNILIENLKQK